ncbi:ankyrin repeat domain-containing protein [Endozoicomonas acroporae]|uniref:ankyrin repeat domain-containing protein n=1 Tax=Endozoicomonas acroporae TaxID=1701104 RepID=UPI0013D09B01|nr:ankyrin repeat domain-containing protein [Endozoicomonas acroporae]
MLLLPEVRTSTLEPKTVGRPLHFAAEKGQPDAIYELIAREADVDARTKNGFTPLKYATEKGQQAAVDALIAYAAKLKKRTTGPHVRKNTVRQC